MRSHLLRVLVAVTIVLTVVSPAAAGSASSPKHTATLDAAYVEQLVQTVSLSAFIGIASGPRDTWFDWSNDGCSAPLVGNTGRSFDFTTACRRHDFGYRNLRLLERRYGTGRTYWNAASRQRVDKRFLADMRDHCASRPWYDKPTCQAWATTFYSAVRVAGGP
ncbi:MAG: phospholipase A2 [Ilumatobacteraceae bacterium]